MFSYIQGVASIFLRVDTILFTQCLQSYHHAYEIRYFCNKQKEKGDKGKCPRGTKEKSELIQGIYFPAWALCNNISHLLSNLYKIIKKYNLSSALISKQNIWAGLLPSFL